MYPGTGIIIDNILEQVAKTLWNACVLEKNYIYNFMNRLQCLNNSILSSTRKSTIPLYSNIWSLLFDILIF